MRMLPSVPRRLLCATAAGLLLIAAGGCSYPIPKELPFYIFFGWGEPGASGPAPAGDGTIAPPSQLDPRVQAAATRMMGYGSTHVGILSNPDVLSGLGRVLDSATDRAGP